MKQLGRLGIAIALAVAIFLAAGAGLFRSLRSEPSSAGSAGPETSALLQPVPAGGSLDAVIAALQERLRANPSDWQGFASLGLAYVQQARVSADPSYYPKAQGVLQKSLRLHPADNFQALVGMGALAAARHDFSGALQWGEKAKAVNPYNASVYGVIGDAQVELGRYDAAFKTFQTMVDTRPDVSSYARVSYSRELMGDVPGAIKAMEGARQFAGSSSDAAWASFQLGELYFNMGDLKHAAEEYRKGVELAPDYVPSHAGLAKVAWARGETSKAIKGYVWVTQRYPSPEYVAALGDLYASIGDTADADQQYKLVADERKLFEAGGVNVDLELSLFSADHSDPSGALDAAQVEWGRRHSIHVADAYAWALYANGDYRQAAIYAKKALALGYKSALFEFHAGMIQLKVGNIEAARSFLEQAVDTNPYFSIIWSPVAAKTLARLGGSK